MRIYLDNCIYQDLKREENREIYKSIIESKNHSIYLFSEAHLYDLSQDKTDEKYTDMDLIESICDNNCLLNDSNGARLLTPREYYDMYNWEEIVKAEDIFNKEDPLIDFIMSEFEKISLPFDSIFKPDILPSYYPKEFIDTMTEPSNLKEYMELSLKASGKMKEHSFFKGILQGNREAEYTEELYKAIGINGFDGEKIIDKEQFRESYIKYINQSYKFNKNRKVDDYQNFMNMYMGLELLNIVKGKPRKQKFTNLMNDSRHAYFGAACDVVVSKDVDFIEKTKFIYDIFDIQTLVLSFQEFNNTTYTNPNNSLNDFLDEIMYIFENLDNDRIQKEGIKFLSIPLSNMYIGYFNILHRVEQENKKIFIASKRVDNYKNKSLIKEIELITNKLADGFGKDIHDLANFNRNEIINGEWNGRIWTFGKNTVYLNYRNIIELIFYKTTEEN